MNVDPSILLSQIAGVQTSVTGYSGSDSIPECTLYLCWYVVNQPFTITTAQRDFFVYPNQVSNNRSTNLYSYKTATQFNAGPFAPTE